VTLSNRVNIEAQVNSAEVHLWPTLCRQTLVVTDRKLGFPRGESLAGAMLRIHSLLRRVPRNTTHVGYQRYCPLVVADLMIIGACSVMYTFVAPLGWGRRQRWR
jgi:hypothetical protein